MTVSHRIETCVICGQAWNVSRQLRLPREGYICPRCTWKREPSPRENGRNKEYESTKHNGR